MSVQLILYPQNYNGQFNAVSNVADEKLVDGILFTSINTSSSYDSASSTYSDTIINQPPNIINTWYRWRSTVTGTPTLPTQTGGNLYLYADNSKSGVYQRLSNLTVGQVYVVTAFFDNTANGTLSLIHWDGTTPFTTAGASIQNVNITASLGWATLNFLAQTTEDIIQIGYNFGASDTLKITHLSVTPQGTAPTGTNFHLEDGQVICDLYQEEDIPLTLSVDDFKNVAEKVQSYSKDFNLPATKRNNLIFDHIFEITRSDDGIIFNPYIKTQCVLKQEGYILFEGYLRLIDVQDQKGEISYNVNLYSEVVALADVLKDRTFADLDLTELAHDYEKTSIKNSWYEPASGTGLPLTNSLSTTSFAYDALLGVNQTNVLKYPFVDWSHQILISNNTGATGPTLNYPELTTLQQVFRPFINIKYLINRIFEATPFSWTSDFFDSVAFDKLFMDFNWGGDATPTASNEYNGTWYYGTGGTAVSNIGNGAFKELRLIPEGVLGGQTGSTVPPNYQGDASLADPYIITATTDNEIYQIAYNFKLKATAGTMAVECKWVHTTAAGIPTDINYQSITTGGTLASYAGSLTVFLQTGDTLKAQFKSTTSIRQREGSFNNASFIVSSLLIDSAGLLTLRGETNQWEFLKGIMTMFNIVSLPDKDNPLNITFEPYGDVFISDTAGLNLASRSIEHDWTDKVDVSEMKLMPLTDLNKQTIFKFAEDDDDYAFNIYKKSTQNHLYGSKVFDASAFTILEGEDEIEAEPFAATVIKPLFDQFSDFVTPAIFTSNEEATEFEGFDNAPRIMFNNGKIDSGITYYIPEQSGLSSENQSDFLQFSHLSAIPTTAGTLDFHFGECQLFNPIGSPPVENLFNLYWLPYYAELYNPDTRIMTMKVNLTPADINTFKMYDRVMIKNRAFRVNKIDYKPNNLATVEFILIP